jgi:uncharacterized Zn-finger protein
VQNHMQNICPDRPEDVKRHSKKPVCAVCNKTFSNNSSLKKHSLVHSAVKPFLCDLCGKGFLQMKHLDVHRSGSLITF